jgi:hypothetical protein
MLEEKVNITEVKENFITNPSNTTLCLIMIMVAVVI